jgi:hypothetical protein
MPTEEPLDLATRLFGEDPDELPGMWRVRYGEEMFAPRPLAPTVFDDDPEFDSFPAEAYAASLLRLPLSEGDRLLLLGAGLDPERVAERLRRLDAEQAPREQR